VPRYRKRWLVCSDCGQETFKRPRWDRPILCEECGVRRAVEAARQMSDKQGPIWDAWLASNAAGAPGQAARHHEE